MLASLLRPGRRPSALLSPFHGRDGDGHGQQSDEDAFADDEDPYDHDDDDEPDDEPVLPLFSAEHLDRLPVYNVTHSIRLIVVHRCETTLSWDQLRSPQVSQFLVKPVQQQIRASHFSRATLYALLANCLQFRKEGELAPGNVGVSRTRGMVCELLAVRLIKDFSTRELIDALSYDFDPLHGLGAPGAGAGRPRAFQRTARISTIEVAIRAQAKRFLAHPLVVQHLEAIWAGSIVFHSAADSLHRKPGRGGSPGRARGYGTMAAVPRASGKLPEGVADRPDSRAGPEPVVRRSVSLYDPRDASLFKLSRLRVPRYRQLFSTLSFAIMLALFLAVLVQRSLDISALEVVFWFWSAGYMLDEIVGFTEQGFNLYIMSVWNAFDLGILMLLVAYYVLRLYGLLMPDVQRHQVADLAYDVLASTAVLLFPRLFSVLDHSRYFSQLLIAFRMMAMDLVAILVLIIISCSGFFVAFTLSFSDQANAARAAYSLFQMLMGFTPAAWELWPEYNPLGKTILTLFLFICHFLIVTILITVLTNSFMAIVQNANEEHQFLFAVNTISMVKSDALFSYIPPTNIFGWLLAPARLVMPFRQFVKLNRNIIKATHFPILFSVFFYERVVLSSMAFEPTDLVEQRGRRPTKGPAFSIRGPGDIFSPGTRLREPSVTTFQKDRALDEVFRRPYRDPTLRRVPSETISERRRSSNVVRDWMQAMGQEGGAASPLEQPRSILERLEHRRPLMRRSKTSHRLFAHRRMPLRKPTASDPEEITSHISIPHAIREDDEDEYPEMSIEGASHQQTDADGDDELVTNDEDDNMTFDHTAADPAGTESDKDATPKLPPPPTHESDESDDYFSTPLAVKPAAPLYPGSASSASRSRPDDRSNATPSGQWRPATARRPHNRNLSTNTVLFSPVQALQPDVHERSRARASNASSRSASPRKRPPTTRSGTATPGRRTPRRPAPPSGSGHAAVRPRPIMPPRNFHQSAPNFPGFPPPNALRNPSFNAVALDLASDIGDNRHGPDPSALATMPASFSTELEMAAAQQFRARRGGEQDPVGRILLARIGRLEEGWREVLREVREWRGRSEGGTRPNTRPGSADERDQKRSGRGRKGKGAAGKKDSAQSADSESDSRAMRSSV